MSKNQSSKNSTQKANRDNRANQLNPNNPAWHTSRQNNVPARPTQSKPTK